eukprot:2798581-Amphidinium_carterae.1
MSPVRRHIRLLSADRSTLAKHPMHTSHVSESKVSTYVRLDQVSKKLLQVSFSSTVSIILSYFPPFLRQLSFTTARLATNRSILVLFLTTEK